MLELDNIAKTILANEFADVEVSIHFDSTENNKGLFYISPFHHEDYFAKYNLKQLMKEVKNLVIIL